MMKRGMEEWTVRETKCAGNVIVVQISYIYVMYCFYRTTGIVKQTLVIINFAL
jgi:hypothetical protein